MRKLILFTTGSIIIGMGIVLTTISGLGPDSFSYSWIGITKTFHITMGQAEILFSLIMLLIPLIYNRKLIGLGTILSQVHNPV